MASGVSSFARSTSGSRVFNIADRAAERRGEFALLMMALPGRGRETAGVLLLDSDADALHIKLRRDWREIADEEDTEVFEILENDLELKAREMGGLALLDWLETNASQTIRLEERQALAVRDFPATLNRLYREHVRTTVRPFRTHLPLYPLQVAAGMFLSNSAEAGDVMQERTEPEAWIEMPEGQKLDGDMFVAHIRGHSMEPRIPDGSLCIFRRKVAGSREGRLVLVRNSELADENQYTVKRYQSEKIIFEDGFRHMRIRLESLNPDYPSWDLDPDETKYEIVAEFVGVIE
jgi:SOS-response transcriptional repressor LexA